MLDPLSFSNKKKYLRTVTQFVILKKKKILTNIRRPWSAFCDDLHEPQKNKKPKKCWWWNENILNWYIHVCGKLNLFLHIRLRLIIWDKCFSFLLHYWCPNLKLFLSKKMPNCSHLCGEAAFAFAERENWLSFRSSLTYPNFQITCVEEQQFVRAWSKGQYVKNTSCSSQFPHQNFGTFFAENLTKW